jgi:hypothetical protein
MNSTTGGCRKHRVAIDRSTHRGAINVDPQRMPLVAVRSVRRLAQIAPSIMDKPVEPQEVVQGVLLDNVVVLSVAHTNGDARVHLGAIGAVGPLLKVARIDAEGLAIDAVGPARRQQQDARLLTAGGGACRD